MASRGQKFARGQAVFHELDVTNQSENDGIVKLAKKAFGQVDVIFLNAGIMPNSPLSAMKTDDWHQMVDVNIRGVLNGVAAVLPTFIEKKAGHVIAMSSVAGLKAYPGCAVYGGTKWFVRDFMEILRMESATEGTNIRTATIYPAAINTELLSTISHQGTAEGMAQLYQRYGIAPERAASHSTAITCPSLRVQFNRVPTCARITPGVSWITLSGMTATRTASGSRG